MPDLTLPTCPECQTAIAFRSPQDTLRRDGALWCACETVRFNPQGFMGLLNPGPGDGAEMRFTEQWGDETAQAIVAALKLHFGAVDPSIRRQLRYLKDETGQLQVDVEEHPLQVENPPLHDADLASALERHGYTAHPLQEIDFDAIAQRSAPIREAWDPAEATAVIAAKASRQRLSG